LSPCCRRWLGVMPYVALKRRDAREPITADGYLCWIRELMEEGGHVAVCPRPRGVYQEGEALEGRVASAMVVEFRRP
jgi:hypothetical protein